MQVDLGQRPFKFNKNKNIVSESTLPRVSVGSTYSFKWGKHVGLLSQKEQVKSWLHQYGFEYNPFAFTDSERDYRLGEYFIEHQDFEKTIGLNDRLVFARPGDGKTAIRLRLQSYYRDSITDHRVFAFSYLIPLELAANPPSSIHGHLNEILTAAVRHAFIFLALRGVEFPQLQNSEQAQKIAASLSTFFDEYYGIADAWQEDLQQAVQDYSLSQVLHNLAPIYDDLESLEDVGSINTQWLQYWLDLLRSTSTDPTALPTRVKDRWDSFANLIRDIGIDSILILVDGVDLKPTSQSLAAKSDSHATNDAYSIDRMVKIIEPILNSLQEHYWGSHMFWKLFLPLELYLPLNSLLPTQIEHDIISWDRNRLLQFLRSRLSSASNGSVTSVNQLLEREVSINLEAYLCVAAESSPRKLIYVLNNIFAVHVSSNDAVRLPRKLSQNTLAKIRFTQTYQSVPIVQV